MVWTVAFLALIPGLASVPAPAPVPVSPSSPPAAGVRVPAPAPGSTRAAGSVVAPAAAAPRRPGPAAGSRATASIVKGRGPAAAAGPDSPATGMRLAMSETTERIPLPRTRGPIVASVDALERRIHLRLSKQDNAKAVAAGIAPHLGMVCPRVEVQVQVQVEKEEGRVDLVCRSGRLEAQITTQGKGSYLDINELRGLPWRSGADAAPTYHYDPWRVGLGQSCPGRTEAVQGECELKAGDSLQAAIHFRKALETSGRQLACLRLGDLAMGIGDPLTAGGWYRRAGPFGVFGRTSVARLCELDGKCLVSTEEVLRVFDPNGLPEPLRAEMTMRAARAESYMGRLPSAAHIIAAQVRAHGATSICREDGEALCRRILLAAMRGAGATTLLTSALPAARAKSHAGGGGGKPPALDKDERAYLEELIETYLALPSWEKGPLAVDMAQAAAPLAARLGAYAFGGNLLASLAPEVPDRQLPEHLLLAAETFLAGQNWARARIVTEYAQTRLGAKGMKGARWIAVFRTLSGRSDENEVSPAVRAAIETELAATLSDLKKTRIIMAKAASLTGGAHAARQAGAGKPGEARSGEARSGEARSGEARSGEARSGEAKPGDTQRDHAPAGAIKPGLAKPENAKRPPAQSSVTPAGAVTAANTEPKR
ncbi:MAG: hypothetical protein ABUS79_03215 [Pseudomonadota bacterium]